MPTKKEEFEAEIRNKLQIAVTVLESLNDDKKIPKKLIERGKKDLQDILKVLDNI